MKRAVIISGVTALALAMGAGMATAKGFGGKGGPKGPRMDFEQVDANNDGLITKEELAAHAQARFNETDTNGDGSLSAAEMAAASERAKEERAQKMIDRKDTNKDGVLSFEEMQPEDDRMAKMFERLDTDGDGAISKEELEAMKGKRKGKKGEKGKRGESEAPSEAN